MRPTDSARRIGMAVAGYRPSVRVANEAGRLAGREQPLDERMEGFSRCGRPGERVAD